MNDEGIKFLSDIGTRADPVVISFRRLRWWERLHLRASRLVPRRVRRWWAFTRYGRYGRRKCVAAKGEMTLFLNGKPMKPGKYTQE